MTSEYRYAELHAHSAYSFLDGANEPADLVAAAVELGLEALALTDHNGMPGIVKHARAGSEHGLPTVHGAELSLADGSRLPILARSPRGYHRLVAAISEHNLQAGQGAEPAHDLAVLAPALEGTCLVLTGTVNGPLRRALGDPGRPESWDLAAADACLGHLSELFADPTRARGRALSASQAAGAAGEQGASVGLAVELNLTGGPSDAVVTQVLSDLAAAHRLPLVATGAVRCARPRDARLADVLTSTGLTTDMERARGHLPAIGRWLRSPADMARLHRRAPHAVHTAAHLGAEMAFDLALIAPQLPAIEVPPGYSPSSWLRELTRRGALKHYGSRAQDPRAWQVLDHELDVIEQLDFPSYFLIVHAIVEYCQQAGILCQGRGSAANSAVCYALGITAVDAVRHRMLFERFLSPGRVGYPDIDLDIESGRREEVIQHVYARYGRNYAAQVANVISYRARSAVRDAARALGYPTGLQDAWASQMERWGSVCGADNDGGASATGAGAAKPAGADSGPPAQVREVAERLLRLPRHLSIHPGGMVLCDRPITEVCPVRWAAMAGRTVLQWDKDDCAAVGLVKFDLLGLGALTALRLAFTGLAQRGEVVPADGTEDAAGDAVGYSVGYLVGEGPAGKLRPAQLGRPWGLHTLPEDDPAVYRLLCAADTVGVFQVESRAQMATLPRLRPQNFYDIVVEVALIRPGPIQGQAVNPYIRRRLGLEEGTYLHESLKPALKKTLGVPLFQEQLMQMAVDAAGFSPAQADALRQAMGAKRSAERMEALHARFVAGMLKKQGVSRELAESVFDKLRAFADFGFPESHAFSFAYLVYASAWLKVRKPEDFYAGILAAQPMGFWSPQSLVADARRHGVRVLPADVGASQVHAVVEQAEQAEQVEKNRQTTANDPHWAPLRPSVHALSPLDVHPDLAVRLGLAPIKGIGRKMAEAIVHERSEHGPYRDLVDLAQRVSLSRAQLEALASAGALRNFGVERRQALWAAGALAKEYGNRRAGFAGSSGFAGGSRQRPGVAVSWQQPTLPGTAVGTQAPALPAMDARSQHDADLRLTGVSTQSHPMEFVRQDLTAAGILTTVQVCECQDGSRVKVAGIVTHRQRPHTASGLVFLNLEDETGLLNIVCSSGMWRRYRRVGRSAAALIVRGVVQQGQTGGDKTGRVCALQAEYLEALPNIAPTRSRDWC